MCGWGVGGLGIVCVALDSMISVGGAYDCTPTLRFGGLGVDPLGSCDGDQFCCCDLCMSQWVCRFDQMWMVWVVCLGDVLGECVWLLGIARESNIPCGRVRH